MWLIPFAAIYLVVRVVLPGRQLERYLLFGHRWRFEDGDRLRLSELQLQLARFVSTLLLWGIFGWNLWAVTETPEVSPPASPQLIGVLVVTTAIIVAGLVAALLLPGRPDEHVDRMRVQLLGLTMGIVALGWLLVVFG